MPKQSKQIIIAYVPVLHRGYLQFFGAFPEAESLYLTGKDLAKEIDYLRKDLRSLEPKQAQQAVEGLGRFKSVEILDAKAIVKVDKSDIEIVMPDDDVSHLLAKRFKQAKLTFYPVFLRWDRRNVDQINEPDSVKSIKADKFQTSIMAVALKAANQSSDIWRRVGAVLILPDGQKNVAANQGEPTPYSPWMEGGGR